MNQALQKLISGNKIRQALTELRELAKFDDDLRTEVLQISARHEEYLRQKRLGVSDDAAANIELSRIRAALIDIGERAGEVEKKPSVLDKVVKNRVSLISIFTICAIAVAAIGYASDGFMNKDTQTENLSATEKPNEFNVTYYKDEKAAHSDIIKDLLKSNKVKLYIIRGSKLFVEDEGIFYLKKYKKGEINLYLPPFSDHQTGEIKVEKNQRN